MSAKTLLPLPERAKPIGAWDTTDPDGLWHCGGDLDTLHEAVTWAKAHIRRADDTYRVEFYLLDAPFGILHRHARDADGQIFVDPETEEVAVEEPVVQMLAELPAAHLLGTP